MTPSRDNRHSLLGLACLTLFTLWMSSLRLTPVYAQGNRLPAMPSAEQSAPGYGPELAVDGNKDTLWIASLKSNPLNNHTWFQLDLGSIKPVTKLYWTAADGIPYPASAPTEYRVLTSKNGQLWTPVPVSAPQDSVLHGDGDVTLNVDARYVRLETSKINDGTGWSLGLREIWVTEGYDLSVRATAFRPRITADDGVVTLSWNVPKEIRPDRIAVYRTDAPSVSYGFPLAVLPAKRREYTDHVPNWTPHYYRLVAEDAGGRSLLTSDLAAAAARPSNQPAPVETFAFWYEAYKPRTDPDATLKHVGNAAFVVGPGGEAAADLAKNGKGALTYMTFYQTSEGIGTLSKETPPAAVMEKIAPIAFYRKGLRFPDSPPGYAPSAFSRPSNVEYDPHHIQYIACPNSLPFRRIVLAHLRQQLDAGVLGVFVDNGYEDGIAASSVCESTQHAHYYSTGLTSAGAFLGLLLDVTCEVKRRHPNGVVIVNGGVPARTHFYGLTLGNVCDGQLWESYLRSSSPTLPEHASNWLDVYARSVNLEKAWHQEPPRRMFVCSYPWDRAEAYFCYATAKLCDLPWSASLGINDPDHRLFGGHFGTYPELVGLRLGRPLYEKQYGGSKAGEVYSREYEHGLVAVNPAKTPQTATLPLSRRRSYQDVYAGRSETGTAISLSLPPESGRVYIWK